MEWLVQTFRTVYATVTILLFILICIVSFWYVVWKLILSKMKIFREISGLQPSNQSIKPRKKVTLNVPEDISSSGETKYIAKKETLELKKRISRKRIQPDKSSLIFESQYISP
ncbi:hypothetical protein K7432_015308 [Basidiobolus ranarum]|uniref:ATP synthase F0 subunit 8 n=1 Tax=Basidiobolus ranarum TaxID=34480 RepID=A0ABR2WGD1_9FUNG